MRKKLGLVIMVLVGVLVVGGVYKQKKWNEKNRITLVFLGKQLTIESIDPTTMTGVKLQIPENLNIPGLGGRGEWLARSINGAGEKKWVADSLANYLGVAYDFYGEHLGWWDMWRYQVWKGKVKWDSVDLVDLNLVKQVKLPDGLEVYVLGPRFDSWVRVNFSDSVISGEGLSVQVINSTGTLGMGNQAARVIENRGIRVASISGQDKPVDKCQLVGNPSLEKTATAGFLVKWFGCEWKKQDDGGVEMTLVLGNDFKNWWLGN